MISWCHFLPLEWMGMINPSTSQGSTKWFGVPSMYAVLESLDDDLVGWLLFLFLKISSVLAFWIKKKKWVHFTLYLSPDTWFSPVMTWGQFSYLDSKLGPQVLIWLTKQWKRIKRNFDHSQLHLTFAQKRFRCNCFLHSC